MNYVTDDTMNAYLRTVQPLFDGVLGEIQREAMAADVPIVPPEVARFISVLLTMQKPKHILEIGTAVAFSLYLKGVSIVGPFMGRLLGMIEPVVAIIVSLAFLGAKFHIMDFVGFVLILGTVVALSLPKEE